jgi:hypothetical protein
MTPRLLDNKEFTAVRFFMNIPSVSLSATAPADCCAGRSRDYRMAPSILKPDFTGSIAGPLFTPLDLTPRGPKVEKLVFCPLLGFLARGRSAILPPVDELAQN